MHGGHVCVYMRVWPWLLTNLELRILIRTDIILAENRKLSRENMQNYNYITVQNYLCIIILICWLNSNHLYNRPGGRHGVIILDPHHACV